MWFGREGRHGVCIVAFSCCVFQIMTANAYIFMHAIQRQLNQDHINSYNHLVIIVYGIRRKKRRKKDNKKASSNILVQTSITNK